MITQHGEGLLRVEGVKEIQFTKRFNMFYCSWNECKELRTYEYQLKDHR